MKKLIMTVLIVLFMSTSSFAAKYGIITADRVNMRSRPATSAPSLGFLEEGELVYSIEKTQEKSKIGADEYYWYKIENHKKMIGYVYGKFIYDFSNSKVSDKEFISIIDTSNESGYLWGRITGIKIDKMESLVFFKVKLVGNGEWEGRFFIFDTSNGIVKCVVKDGFYDEDYFMDNSFVFLWSKSTSIQVYERSPFANIYQKDSKSSYYKLIGYYNIYKHHPKSDFKDRGLSFDPKTMILTVTVRDPKDAPITTERFKFNGKEFVPMGEKNSTR